MSTPLNKDTLLAELKTVLGESAVCVDEPMCEHTTFHIGGPADIFVIPETKEQLVETVALCRKQGLEPFFLGCGSDLLVSDSGMDGVVIDLSSGPADIRVFGNTMICDAGVTLKDAAELACELGLSGLEFACGIPGSVGGACFMNAGAYGGSIADVLKSVEVLTPQGKVCELGVNELNLGYRKSRVADEGLLVLSATFELQPGDRVSIRKTMDDLNEQRAAKQPLDIPSAGSTFKRPEGYFAGKLITDAGLKGYRSGGAVVSEKHAGFVVNIDSATAQDVLAVIRHVQEEVKHQFGVDLEPEVCFVGRDAS